MGDGMKVVFLLLLCYHSAQGQICTRTNTIGEWNTASESNNRYDTTIYNAVLCFDNQFKFDCCGYIGTWEIYVRSNAGSPIDVTLQVWENTGTVLELVGENVVTTIRDNNENVLPIANGNRIRVKKDDYIGFYQHAGSVITYGGGNNRYRVALFAGAQTTYDWSNAAGGNSRDHAIHARVVPSAIPRFDNLDDTVSLPNTQAGGSSLFTLVFSDTDAEDTLTVTQTGTTGSAAAYFEYDSTTFSVKVRHGVVLVPGSQTMTFTVTDVCGRSRDGTLTLRITNLPPVITSLPNNAFISEDLGVKTLLHTLVVTDTVGSTITCSMSTGGVPFTVERVSGSTDWGIYFDATSTMDYDTQNAYVLTVSCTDTYDPVTGTFTVHLIKNQPPTINGLPLAVDVSEDTTIETTIYTISVTDPENKAVQCDVTSVTPTASFLYEKPSANFNEFDFVLASNAPLNYDSVRTYRLDLSCNDERRSDTNVFFVNILRNQPPVFANLQNITTVSSINSYIGQIVFDVDVTDKENDQVQFSMTCPTSRNCPFEIYHSGEIVLTRSVEGEFVPAYDIYVTVTDGKNTVGPRSLTVHILDINYVPVITNLPLPSALVVSENAAPGLSVFQVSVQDIDRSDTHTYAMTSSPSTGMLYFEIVQSTGLVRASLTNNINYEDILPTTGFTFTVTVTDTKDSASKNLTVTIADVNERPVFTKKSYVLSTNEGAAGTVLADPGYLYTDEDPRNTHRYSMVCAGNAGYFGITPATGIIRLTTDLDVDGAGLPTSYTCTITVSDGSLTDTALLTINVNNINDNTPTFASNLYTYYVDLNTAVNTVIGSTVATDGDIGTFGTFTYSVDQAPLGTETFGIQSNGNVYLKSALTSYGYGQSLRFRVLATDTGGLEGTATVFVVIPQTTTTTTTTTDRPLTFMEYAPNMAWLVVACVMGLVILIVPCFMLYKTGGTCVFEGSPLGSKKEYHVNDGTNTVRPSNARNGKDWKPWKWHERR